MEAESSYTKLIQQIRAVLLSQQKGVRLDKFPSDFKKLVGYCLPYEKYGYKNCLSFLKALEQEGVVYLKRDNGSWILYGMANESHFMPSWIKKATDKIKQQCKQEHESLSIEQTEYPSLSYDSFGRVSVYVEWKTTGQREFKPAKVNLIFSFYIYLARS